MTCPAFDIIATGSSGNCAILEGFLALDMGVSFKAIEPYSRALRLVLLTHVHGDHLNPATVARLARERPSLRFGGGPWIAERLLNLGVPMRQIDVMISGKAYRYDNLIVRPFGLRHDVPNYGYELDFGGKTAMYATDAATLDGISLPGLDLYLVEGNHGEEELAERIRAKEAAGEYCHELRTAATHLSKERANDWLVRNMAPGSAFCYLHGHRED